MISAEKIVGTGDPLVQVFLHQPAGNNAGFSDARQSGIAGAHVERLFPEHITHGAAQRSEGGVLQHLELELAIAVDKVGEGEEVQPVVALFIKGAEHALVFIRLAFQHFLGLDFARGTKVVDQQGAHLPAVTHLFNHDAGEAGTVIVAGRGLKEPALLFHAGKLGVTLVDDQVHEGVTHVLCGDLAHVFPLVTAFVVAERDFLGLNGAVQSVKPEILYIVMIDADFFAPSLKKPFPIAERSDLHYFSRHRKQAPLSEIPNAKREGSLSILCALWDYTNARPGINVASRDPSLRSGFQITNSSTHS